MKGAGATAPYLGYAKWIAAYKDEVPAVRIDYQQTGSGKGIEMLQAGTVDFIGTDIPISDEQIANMKVKPLHFPTLVEAVVPVYNIEGVTDLQFTGEVLAGIYSGKIRNWNDPAIAKVNAGKTLPDAKIVAIHRQDASGMTYALTDYLSKVSPSWKEKIGQGATVKWPTGEGATGNDGVAEKVKSTPNSIGYVEYNHAEAQKLAYGSVKNAAGKFQRPLAEALGAAVELVKDMKSDFRASIVNAPGKEAYPISTLTYIVVPKHYEDAKKEHWIKNFLRWCYTDGQKVVNETDYVVLQPPLLDIVRDQLGDIQ